MFSSDRPTALDAPPIHIQEEEHQPTQPMPSMRRVSVPPPEWRPWLIAQLVRLDFATRSTRNPGKIRYYLTDLEAAIARELPEAPVPLETLRSVVYRGTLPSHHTARGLAAAFGVSELAILLRSGQLDWDAVEPLLGPVPSILYSEQEYMAEYTRVNVEIADPDFRERRLDRLNRDREDTQRLEQQVSWLGITHEEWERLRPELNSPLGRDRLRRAVFGLPLDDEPPQALPQEFLAAANNASRDL